MLVLLPQWIGQWSYVAMRPLSFLLILSNNWTVLKDSETMRIWMKWPRQWLRLRMETALESIDIRGKQLLVSKLDLSQVPFQESHNIALAMLIHTARWIKWEICLSFTVWVGLSVCDFVSVSLCADDESNDIPVMPRNIQLFSAVPNALVMRFDGKQRNQLNRCYINERNQYFAKHKAQMDISWNWTTKRRPSLRCEHRAPTEKFLRCCWLTCAVLGTAYSHISVLTTDQSHGMVRVLIWIQPKIDQGSNEKRIFFLLFFFFCFAFGTGNTFH